MTVTSALASDAMTHLKSARESMQRALRAENQAHKDDFISAAMASVFYATASVEAIRAKDMATPRPLTVSPTAGG